MPARKQPVRIPAPVTPINAGGRIRVPVSKEAVHTVVYRDGRKLTEAKEDVMQWWKWQRAQDRLENHWGKTITDRGYTIRFDDHTPSHCNFGAKEVVVNPDWMQLAKLPITFPIMWRGRECKTMAEFQACFARFTTRHEACHVRFTDLTDYVFQSDAHSWMQNALEDGRIEIQAGMLDAQWWQDFRQFGRLIWRKPQTNPNDREGQLMYACLYHRWDVFVQHEGQPSKLRPDFWLGFGATEQAAMQKLWETELRPLVEDAWHATDSKTCGDIALKIVKIIYRGTGGGGGGGGGGRSRQPEGDEHKDGNTDKLPNQPGDGYERRHYQRKTKREDGTESQRTYQKGDEFRPEHAADDPAFGATPDNDLDLGQGNLTGEKDPSYGTLFHAPGGGKISREIRPLAKRLEDILYVPTNDVDPVADDRRGRFNTRAYTTSLGERPLMQPREEGLSPKGMAVMVLIDGSGSMGVFTDPNSRMSLVGRALMALDLACAKAGIAMQAGLAGIFNETGNIKPVRVRARTGTGYEHIQHEVRWIKTFDQKGNEEAVRARIVGLGQRMSHSESVSTSLRIGWEVISQRPEPIKVIISMHDGHPTDETRPHAAETVGILRSWGADLLGIGLGDVQVGGGNGSIDGIKRLMQEIYGTDPLKTLLAPNLRDLPVLLGRAISHLRK